MMISLDAEKNHWQYTTFFLDKGLGESRDNRTYLNTIIAIYSKPTTNIKLNGEKFPVIPL